MIVDPRRGGLGRGLSALLGEENGEGAAEAPRLPRAVPVELLHPGRYQPRRNFDPESQQALVESIKAQGILQPLLVRRHPEMEGHFEIVAGERRWRAAQAAQLHEVPVLLREIGDREALEIALVENIQRQDLNAMEEAEAYSRLMEEFRHTQEGLAQAVGKSRSYIANSLRLLSLPEEVRTLVREGKLTAGHARSLIGMENAAEVAHKIVKSGMSVRQVERLARAQAQEHREKHEKPASHAGEPGASDTAVLERELTQLLGLKVQIVYNGPGGILSIH